MWPHNFDQGLFCGLEILIVKTRIVWTKIWEDDWFQSLSDQGQKLFLYLITNRIIGLSGCYQISDFMIKAQARIKDVEKAKKELFPKVKFFKDWVHIRNAQGYGGYTGEKLLIALNKELDEIPKDIKDVILSDKDDRVSIGYGGGIDTPINHKSIIINKYIKREELEERDFEEIAEKYKVPVSFVKSKFEDVCNWEDERPGKMKGRNWRLTLMNWVKRDSLQIKMDYGKDTSDLALD